MCLDDGCDELLCCLCAPVAALLCCTICKNKMDRNDVHQAPPTAFYQQPTGHPIPPEDIYGPRSYYQQPQFYPGGPQPYYASQNPSMQGNYFPPYEGYTRNDLPSVHFKQQPMSYR